MASALRVLLWTVALLAPGGFLLVPVLVLHPSQQPPTALRFRQRFSQVVFRFRRLVQRYWTKS
jgi:hypothetical protein